MSKIKGSPGSCFRDRSDLIDADADSMRCTVKVRYSPIVTHCTPTPEALRMPISLRAVQKSAERECNVAVPLGEESLGFVSAAVGSNNVEATWMRVHPHTA